MSVAAHVERLGRAWVDQARTHTGQLPVTTFDPDWPSPCVVQVLDDEKCYWQPVAMTEPPAFARLANAMEQPVQPDLVQLFSVAWSASLPVEFDGNQFELLQLWSSADFDNLLSNQIGHAMEKKRVRQPLSFFFALVDEKRFLSVDNASGEVLLETLGTRQPTSLAPGLELFLEQVRVCEPDAGQGNH